MSKNPITVGGAAPGPAPDALASALQPFAHAELPACIVDPRGRLALANEAMALLLDSTPRALCGRRLHDVLGLRGDTDGLAAAVTLPSEFAMLDAQGQQRWLRPHLLPLDATAAPSHRLLLLLDATIELASRERHERKQQELQQWLDLSPQAMVLFDGNGLILQSNQAFDSLSSVRPATLHDTDPMLQQALGWSRHGNAPVPPQGREPRVTQVIVTDAEGRPRWLQGRVQALPRSGPRTAMRYIAVLEDRSPEQERDLAHQQLDALMDTAGVGLATFQQDAGWLRPRQGRSGGLKSSLGGLQGVSRDIVERASLPEFERLQKALKKGERVEVRYAVRHPELGRRWLLTRVEPGQLVTGQKTTSVVTLDITVQQQAQARSEQLLHELTTIMDSASLGLAYLRNGRLVRCNPRFVHMLGLKDAPTPGVELNQLLSGHPDLQSQIQTAGPALDGHPGFEAEFTQTETQGQDLRWYALSLRRIGSSRDDAESEMIAVISDITRLKVQQAELENLVRDRELMFSLSDVGIAIIRHDRIERANDALSSMSGYRINELIGLPLRALYETAAEFEQAQPAMQQALRQQGLWRGERRLRRHDGNMLWMQVSKRVMRPGAPEEGLIATFVNVDDRHKAQQSLVYQTERERAVLDSVLVGIVTVGRDGIEWMNRSARRMFGGDLVDFAGKPMSVVATPAPDHPFRQTQYLDELAEGQAETFECRLKARDGREFWVVGNAVVIGLAASGRQLTYALLDIERRRLAEAQTLQAQASLRRIIEAAPLAISLHDAKTLCVEKVNQAAAALAGRSEAELMGASPEDLFGTELGQQIRQDMEASLVSSEVLQHEYRLELDGQSRVWDARLLHLSEVSALSGMVEPDQVLLVASDVTEQRAAEAAKLEAAISQRELLVREVHHRIKNNLQGVAGLLQQVAARRPEVKSVINEAVSQVQAIAQVYGLQVGASGPLRIRQVVEAITGSVQRMFGRPIQTGIEGPCAHQAHTWALPEAESIPIALTLNELLTNAIKHSPEGSIQCQLVLHEQKVEVRISNLGQLPEGFSLAKVPGGVSGLGLVRALLPRRTAKLQLSQDGPMVCCTVELQPPSVTLLDPL